MLPYIEQDNLFKQYRFDEPWNGANNSRLADRIPKTLSFTGMSPGNTTTNYLAVVGAETMWPGKVGRKSYEIKDDPSETILVVENQGLNVHWMEPRDLDFGTMPFEIDHPEGVSSWYQSPAVATVGRTERRLSKSMAPVALRAALTVAGGEKLADEAAGWTVIPDGRDRPLK